MTRRNDLAGLSGDGNRFQEKSQESRRLDEQYHNDIIMICMVS